MNRRLCAFLFGFVAAAGFGYGDPGAATSAGSEGVVAPSDTAIHDSQEDRAATGEQAHGEHHPIDCPLRTQGIDPSDLRPFEDVEQYIAFLEREDRATWQKPEEVIAALDLNGDETVVDLGAGSGYFAFRFAEALPQGRVIAADTEPEMIRHIHHKVVSEGIQNIDAMLVRPDVPTMPDDVDLVFICDVLHHVPDRSAWLGEIADAMPSGARLVLIEFKEGDLPKGPPASVKIPRTRLLELAADAGLVMVNEPPDLLPYQIFLIFGKP